MLTNIFLQNFAISASAEVELDHGMTVLTGETGAGKSILIDALNLALGDRADSAIVRHGTDRASIHASFTLEENSPAHEWLKSQEMDNANECLLRRVITVEGRSRAFINDTPVNLSSLRTLGEMLVEIHGQHEHQSLMKSERQRQVIDNIGDYSDLLANVSTIAQQIKQCREELDRLQISSKENNAQLELLRYQTQELEALDIPGMDIPVLTKEHEQANHAGTLLDLCTSVCQQLKENDDSSVSQQISQLITRLEPWQDASDEIKSTIGVFHDINVLVDEAARSLHSLQERLDIDPQRLAELDSLISALFDLARKHATDMTSLPAVYEEKISQLDKIDHGEHRLNELSDELDQLKAQYHKQAEKLHEKRRQTASKLSEQVTQHMQTLGMSGGHFEITVGKRPDKDRFSPFGIDDICFMVTANPGQPLQPLQKVASGGELSRISLAITVVSAACLNAPTMIFDEVDTGIGGGVAEIVGRELNNLSEDRQVLCVTHLPQVAAQGDHHFRVVKTSSDSHTESRVIPLDEDGRTHEIARMLGGVEITEQSLEHARELLGQRSVARVS